MGTFKISWNGCGRKVVGTQIRKSVSENGNVKLLWDFNIQTDREKQACRPNIMLMDRKNLGMSELQRKKRKKQRNIRI